MGVMTLIFAGLAILLLGLALGASVCYIYAYEPLLGDYRALVEKMLYMKRQGFVPQFDIEQRREIDLSAEIREF